MTRRHYKLPLTLADGVRRANDVPASHRYRGLVKPDLSEILVVTGQEIAGQTEQTDTELDTLASEWGFNRAALDAADIPGLVEGGEYPNEPEGYTLLVQEDWTQGFGENGWAGIGSDTTIEDDATVPGGGGKVMQHRLHENTPSGSGLDCRISIPETFTKIYVGQWIKVSDPWVPHPSGVHKYLFFRTTHPPNGDSLIWMEFFGTNSATMKESVVPQLKDCGTDRYNGTINWPLDTWLFTETLFEMRDNATANNGRIRVWHEETLEIDQEQLCTTDGDTERLSNATLSGMYGGVGEHDIVQDQFIWRGPVRISLGT